MPAPAQNQNAALPPGEAATSFLYIRCTPAEKAAWVRAAKGQPLSAWVRDRLKPASPLERSALKVKR